MLVFYYCIGKKTAHSGVVKKSRTEHFCSIRLGTGVFEELPMQEQKNNEDTLTDDAIEAGIEELTLALLYLKRFKWNHDDQVARASWRSFDWETLDNLLQSSDLSGCDHKAVWISDEGIRRARNILEKYGLSHLEGAAEA